MRTLFGSKNVPYFSLIVTHYIEQMKSLSLLFQKNYICKNILWKHWNQLASTYYQYIKTLHPCILYIIANVKAMMKPIHIVNDIQKSIYIIICETERNLN